MNSLSAADRQRCRAARTAFVQALAPQLRHGLETALAGLVVPRLGPPAILASYAAIGEEIGPGAVERAAVALGWALAFPRVIGSAPLAFHRATAAELVPGFRHIPEPAEQTRPVRPDVLLVPLLAADRHGHRLGQGGGHYDRTLAALRAEGPLLAIGLAWDMQIVDSIAARPWDQPLDALATPTAFHAVPGGATRVG